MSWPKALSLWSGYYSSTLAICAFAMFSQVSQNTVEAFGNILFACAISMSLGFMIGRKLACKRPQISYLTKALSLASAFALAPILLHDLARLEVSALAKDARTALFITGCFIPPLTLLSIVPSYASAIITRNRINGGSASGVVLIWSVMGFAIGGLFNAHFVLHELAVENVLKINLAFSAIMVLTTLIQNPPRKLRVR